jgi:RimJ/RimL family protein N-acetyltransferase
MDPLLLDIPDAFETERLLLRTPRAGDGPVMNAAIAASHSLLQPWMDWAQTTQTAQESERYCRMMYSHYIGRTQFAYNLLRKSDGAFVGHSSLHTLDWTVPAGEIGYWVHADHQGQGYITEAVIGICKFAFEVMDMARVELRCNVRNTASAAVARRAGFALCGTLHNNALDVYGSLRSTHVFEKLSPHIPASG